MQFNQEGSNVLFTKTIDYIFAWSMSKIKLHPIKLGMSEAYRVDINNMVANLRKIIARVIVIREILW